MKKLVLATLVSSALIGCGGSDSDSSPAPTPAPLPPVELGCDQVLDLNGNVVDYFRDVVETTQDGWTVSNGYYESDRLVSHVNNNEECESMEFSRFQFGERYVGVSKEMRFYKHREFHGLSEATLDIPSVVSWECDSSHFNGETNECSTESEYRYEESYVTDVREDTGLIDSVWLDRGDLPNSYLEFVTTDEGYHKGKRSYWKDIDHYNQLHRVGKPAMISENDFVASLQTIEEWYDKGEKLKFKKTIDFVNTGNTTLECTYYVSNGYITDPNCENEAELDAKYLVWNN